MQVTLKDKKGHEDYSLGLKLPNKGTGCFTFEAVQTQGKPEIRIVFNSKATDSRDSTAPVISLVIRSKASNSQTTLSFKNPGKPQASIPFEGPEDCFLSHSPKSFWISIQNICHHVNAAVDQVDNTLVLFGAGNQPGKYIRLVVAVDSSVSLPEYVGISNWEGTTLLSNYLVSDPPKLGFTTCRLINQNPKNGAQLPCPTITLEPQFTILKAYDTLCDNTLSTCMWSHAIRFRDELAFCIIGPHKEQCKASFNWKGASNLALVASTNTKSINIRIPLDKGKGIITLIQKGIPLAEASRRHPEATDIFTILKKDAIQLRIEHFSNGRIAPHYSGISPDVLAKQALSALHLMVATREILLDSKWNELLQHKEGKDAFFSLMGFEATVRHNQTYFEQLLISLESSSRGFPGSLAHCNSKDQESERDPSHLFRSRWDFNFSQAPYTTKKKPNRDTRDM